MKAKIKKYTISIPIAVCSLLLPTLSFAQQSPSISGYFKNFSVVFNPPSLESTFFSLPDSPIGLVNNRLRVQSFYQPANFVSFTLVYDISPRIQDPLLFDQNIVFTEINPYQYRFSDLHRHLYPARDQDIRSFAVFQNLDRALVTIHTKPADIFIGRQAIAWGSARVVNPTDVIAPFTFEELDTEDRIGVDALRIRIPIGFMGEIDLGAVAGKDFKFDQSAFFLRGKYYFWQTDVSALLIGFRENILLGLDLARAIGGAGFWFEAAQVFVDALKENSTHNGENYFRATIGADYSFSSKTYGFIEYHYSEAGSTHPGDYLSNFSKTAFQEGAVYLMGRHYLIPGLNYQITPLITFTAQVLANITDPSLFLAPQVEYNIAENIYISGGAFVGLGKSTNSQNQVIPTLQSEFGGYPDIFYTSFRIYF